VFRAFRRGGTRSGAGSGFGVIGELFGALDERDEPHAGFFGALEGGGGDLVCGGAELVEVALVPVGELPGGGGVGGFERGVDDAEALLELLDAFAEAGGGVLDG